MLQDITQLVLANAMDASAMRHRAIANNIANVETPGYQRQDVNFESALRGAMDTPELTRDTQDSQVANVTPQMTHDAAGVANANGNTVDPDREMSQLAENTIHYQALLQSMSVKDSMLRAAIYEGRK